MWPIFWGWHLFYNRCHLFWTGVIFIQRLFLCCCIDTFFEHQCNETEFENSIMSQKRNTKHIFITPYNLQRHSAVEAFNRTVEKFLTRVKNHQKDYDILSDSISDFLIYYNVRFHLTIKVSPFKGMMNISDKELIGKLRNDTLKRRLKRKYSICGLILMAVMFESQITLKLLTNSMSFSSSKRIIKVLDLTIKSSP